MTESSRLQKFEADPPKMIRKTDFEFPGSAMNGRSSEAQDGLSNGSSTHKAAAQPPASYHPGLRIIYGDAADISRRSPWLSRGHLNVSFASHTGPSSGEVSERVLGHSMHLQA
jgi:hypothetical protein